MYPKAPLLVSPVLVEGIGDELRVEGDVREAIAVLDSADHSRPGKTVAQNLAPAAPPLRPPWPTRPGETRWSSPLRQSPVRIGPGG